MASLKKSNLNEFLASSSIFLGSTPCRGWRRETQIYCDLDINESARPSLIIKSTFINVHIIILMTIDSPWWSSLLSLLLASFTDLVIADIYPYICCLAIFSQHSSWSLPQKPKSFSASKASKSVVLQFNLSFCNLEHDQTYNSHPQ